MIKLVQNTEEVIVEKVTDFFFYVNNCKKSVQLCSCSHSTNVKKSISSDGAALFQYAKRASKGEEG